MAFRRKQIAYRDIISFKKRVIADGGIIESPECIDRPINADFHFQPSGFKAGVAYVQKPNNSIGDFAVSRSSIRTRRIQSGIIETLANHVPAYDYKVGSTCPILSLGPQSINLYLNSELNNVENTTVTATAYTVFLYGTGTITFSGAYVGTLVGTGVNDKVEVTFTPSAGTLTSTDTGSVDKKQIENLAYSTSYIKTTGITATRLQDVLSGAGDSSTFNDTDIVLVIKCRKFIAANIGHKRITISDGTLNNLVEFRYNANANGVVGSVASAGVITALSSNPGDASEFHTFIVTSEQNKTQIWIDGSKTNESLLSNTPIGLNTLKLSGGAGANTFEGEIEFIKTYIRVKAEIDYPYLIE